MVARAGWASGLSVFYFFFSSRRRHTRLQGDWSSRVLFRSLFVCADDFAAGFFHVLVYTLYLTKRKHVEYFSDRSSNDQAIDDCAALEQIMQGTSLLA